MSFEWDEAKNVSNQKKHKISFEIAKLVFEDPYHMSCQDRHEDSEERWQTIGNINGIAVVLVAHTVRSLNGDEVIRIISARRATKTERRYYEQTN
jgi:uncharacterized DUF497 family protein